jgi:hypothetical protein
VQATPPDELMAALEALASAGVGGTEPGGAPDSAASVHALAFEFAFMSVLQLTPAAVTASQRATLNTLNAFIGTLGDSSSRPALWTDLALRSTPEWLRVRQLAEESLVALRTAESRPQG